MVGLPGILFLLCGCLIEYSVECRGRTVQSPVYCGPLSTGSLIEYYAECSGRTENPHVWTRRVAQSNDSSGMWLVLKMRAQNRVAPGTRRVFKKREQGKHAEIEMFEWLTSMDYTGRELQIVVRRAPCEACLKRIIALQERNYRFVTFRIGFAHWYGGSNSHQVYASVIDQKMEYTMLSEMEMNAGVFSPMFGSTLHQRSSPIGKSPWSKHGRTVGSEQSISISTISCRVPE